jgi:hypothetical protein
MNQVVPILLTNLAVVSVTDDKHKKQVDELIKYDRLIIQKQIARSLGMSNV